MLGSLAKRLRLLGHDVVYAPSLSDNEIIRISLEQDRVILTRDAGLAARPLARSSILIAGNNLREQLRQVERTCPPPSPDAALTRCSLCNGLLRPAARAEVRDQVPQHVLERVDRFRRCAGCGRIYWEGTHVEHLRRNMQK